LFLSLKKIKYLLGECSAINAQKCGGKSDKSAKGKSAGKKADNRHTRAYKESPAPGAFWFRKAKNKRKKKDKENRHLHFAGAKVNVADRKTGQKGKSQK